MRKTRKAHEIFLHMNNFQLFFSCS